MESYKRQTVFYLNSLPPVSIRGLPLDVDLNVRSSFSLQSPHADSILMQDPMFHVMATKWGAVLAQHSPICPGDLCVGAEGEQESVLTFPLFLRRVFVLSSRDAEEKLFAEKTYDLRLDINESEYLNLRLSVRHFPGNDRW